MTCIVATAVVCRMPGMHTFESIFFFTEKLKSENYWRPLTDKLLTNSESATCGTVTFNLGSASIAR